MRDGAVAKEDDVLSAQIHAAPAGAGPEAALAALPGKTDSEQLLALILKSLDDDKAEEVVTIDLRGRSAMADYMIVASGRSARQVSAIAEKLAERLKEVLGQRARSEGKEQGDWVLIDAGDVVVHVFRPEVREFYQIEKMWMPAGRGPRA